MTRVRRICAVMAAPVAVGLLLAAVAPVAAQEAGTESGALTVRMTLKGSVDAQDEFLVIIDCADEWCDDETVDAGLPDGKIVIFCGNGVADAPTCAAQTFEFTREIQTGPIEYWFYRVRGSQGEDVSDWQLLHSGTGSIHSGSQTLTMEYVYPGGSGAGGTPTLPDTALPAP